MIHNLSTNDASKIFADIPWVTTDMGDVAGAAAGAYSFY